MLPLPRSFIVGQFSPSPLHTSVPSTFRVDAAVATRSVAKVLQSSSHARWKNSRRTHHFYLVPPLFFVPMPLQEDPKAVCWRPKQALIECIIKTKCFQEMQQVEPCIAASECYHERKNWVLCKCNVSNPRYRLRGNPYDIGSEDQKKIEARNERIAKRQAEEQGLDYGSNRVAAAIAAAQAATAAAAAASSAPSGGVTPK